MIAPDPPADLASYDLIVLNTSGGKDSAVMCQYVADVARAAGAGDRMVAVHATFPEEWPGTVDLVRRQTTAIGVPLEVVTRGEGLLDYARRRGKWPSPKQRWCTSDFKRAPIQKVITRRAPGQRRRARVLNVMGMRAAESPARAKLLPFARDRRKGLTNTRRATDTWLPIFRLSTPDVWRMVAHYGLEMHPAYAAGMPRLSCSFCIFAPRAALLLAGRLRPEMLAEYVAVERATGHRFRQDLALADVQAALDAGEAPTTISDWRM